MTGALLNWRKPGSLSPLGQLNVSSAGFFIPTSLALAAQVFSAMRTPARILTLPCKACGKWRVAFCLTGPFGSFGPERCGECWSAHNLTIRPAKSGWLAVYDRNTLRYPEEHAGEPVFPIIRISATRADDGDGPIMVAKRKTYFSRQEVEAVWKRTSGMCHLCKRKPWRLEQRGRYGWHIDHVLPNIGGLGGTESPDNFRLACAKCNLRKGRGYRHGEIRRCLTGFMKRWGY